MFIKQVVHVNCAELLYELKYHGIAAVIVHETVVTFVAIPTLSHHFCSLPQIHTTI